MTKRTISHLNLNEARILVVEDEPTLAYVLEECLIEAGYEIAGVAGRVAQALKMIERGDCDAAIIDTNLAGVSAVPVALALDALSIPFVVLSGYSREQQQSAFRQARLLRKPCRPNDLLRAVQDLFLVHPTP